MSEQFNFDHPVDRTHTFSLKWQDPEDQYPLWVADMDFECAPAIREAVEKRAAHGIFGYSVLDDGLFKAVQDWYRNEHDLELEPEALVFSTGAIPALSSMIRKLSTPAEKVIVLSPVYNIFYNSIINNGRIVVESELKRSESGYGIDFEDLEEKMADPQSTLMILCNPHNPVGRIWSETELERIVELANAHGVTIISDEVHADLTHPGHRYFPLAKVKDAQNHISIYSPSKTFNLAGLQSAMVYTQNPLTFHKIWRGLNTDEVAEPNAFAQIAAIAAYEKGRKWLKALKEYLFENKQYIEAFIEEHCRGVKIIPSQATYLMWLDVSEIGDADELAEFLKREKGLHLSKGSEFGKGGKNFLRLNYATSKDLLHRALQAFCDGISQFERAGNE